jgi:hypothetical protein
MEKQDVQTVTIFYSDFKDCPTVSAMLTNLARAGSIKIVEFRTTHMIVEGKKYLLDAIYTG